MNEMDMLSKKFPSESALTPAILGRRFKFQDEEEVFVVLGMKWAAARIVLQSESTAEIWNVSAAKFLKTAKRSDV